MLATTLLLLLFSPVIHARSECPVMQGQSSSKDAAILPVSNPATQYYFYLGGMFGVHDLGINAYECGAIRERGVQNLEMFIWAVKTFNQRYSMTNQTQIGAIAFDSCSRQEQTIEKLMSFEKCSIAYYQDQQSQYRIDPRFVLTYIGPDRSGEAIVTAEILKDMVKVQVSHAATTSELNDKQKYPYFLRTAQSNDNEIRGILRIMKELSFWFTLVVYSDNIYGQQMYEVFKSNAEQYGVCIVMSRALPLNTNSASAYEELIDSLLDYRSVYSLVVLGNDNHATSLMKHLELKNKPGAFSIFGVNSWGNKEGVIAEAKKAAEGAVTVAMIPQNGGDITKFKTHFLSLNPNTNKHNPWFGEYWEAKYECDLGSNTFYNKKCNILQQDKLTNVDFDVFLPNTKLAVDAALLGIEEARAQKCGSSNSICPRFINPTNLGDQIFSKTSKIKIHNKPVFNNVTGGTATWQYQIYNVINGIYRKVGTFTSEDGLLLTETIRNHKREPYRSSSLKPACPMNRKCCGKSYTPAPSTDAPRTSTTPTVLKPGHLVAVYFDNDTAITGIRRTHQRPGSEYRTRFELNQNWIIALGVLAGLGIVCVCVLELYIMYKVIPDNSENRRLRSMWLGQLLIFGILLSYLTLFAYIPEPTKATCTITRLGVGMSYAICFSVLLVKLMVIMTSKPDENDRPGEFSNYLKCSYQVLMFIFAIGVQVVIDVQWLITIPPDAVKVKTLNDEYAWVCNHYTWSPAHGYTDMNFFLRSEFENHVISLVYVMFLIFLTCVLAIKSHGIVTNHAESIFIGLSAGFAIPVWLAWTLIAHFNGLNPYAHQYGDACMAFGLFVTATIILAAMFLPKVRQLNSMGIEGIYLEDDVDTVYNGSVYGVPPSYRSKNGPGSVVYMNGDQGIYSEPLATLDPRATHLKYPASNYSVHSLPAYVRRPESVYINGGGTMKMVTVTPDLTGKHRKTQSEFGTTKSNRSEKGSTLKKARSTQDIGAL